MLNVFNYLNRSIAVVVLFVLCLGALGLAGAGAYDLLHAGSFSAAADAGFLAHFIDAAAEHAHELLLSHGVLILGLCAALALLSAALLWAELRMVIAQPQLILSRGHLGQVAISLDQIGLLAQHEAERIDGVREVHTIAHAGKTGINVQQTIAVEPEQPLPALAEQVQQRVKHSLEFHLGFPVAAVRVQLQQASLSKALL